MGNNGAFTTFEATVIATYNKGVLDKELLSSFMEQYRGMDIDSGGMRGTLSNDGMDVVGITIKIFGGEIPKRPDLPQDHLSWSPEQYDINDAYNDELWGKFNEITDRFGWA